MQKKKVKAKQRQPVAVTGAAAGRKPLRLHGSIARDIGVMIVSGRYRPGHVLDGEVEASEQRKVSRTAYREAVRILAAKGLVHSRPRVGTRVSQLAQPVPEQSGRRAQPIDPPEPVERRLVGRSISLRLIHQFGFKLSGSQRGKQRGLGTQSANRDSPMVSQSAAVTSACRPFPAE